MLLNTVQCSAATTGRRPSPRVSPGHHGGGTVNSETIPLDHCGLQITHNVSCAAASPAPRCELAKYALSTAWRRCIANEPTFAPYRLDDGLAVGNGGIISLSASRSVPLIPQHPDIVLHMRGGDRVRGARNGRRAEDFLAHHRSTIPAALRFVHEGRCAHVPRSLLSQQH